MSRSRLDIKFATEVAGAMEIEVGGVSAELKRCRICLRRYSVQADGTIEPHKRYGVDRWDGECPGSNTQPGTNTYALGNGEVAIVTDPEETCEMCENHRRFVANKPAMADAFPFGVPRCTFHLLRKGAELDVADLRAELQAMPRMVDRLADRA